MTPLRTHDALTIRSASGIALVATLAVACGHARPALAESLAEAEPLDVIVLRGGGDDGRLEVYPVELPVRRVPDPRPDGSISVRTLANPGEPLVVDWSAIESIEFFEAKLMAEAIRLTRAKNFAAAFDHLARLERDYPSWPGLDAAFTSFLRSDAQARFRAGDPEHALAILHTLYQRNPDARGVRQAVEAVGGRMLKTAWESEDYRVVGATLSVLRQRFQDLDLTLIDQWQGRLEANAQQSLDEAERALAAGDFGAARRYANEAAGLLPDSAAPREMLQRIEQANPTARVGVILSSRPASVVRLDTPVARRHSRLLGGLFARLDDYSPTGGVYSSPLGEVRSDDSKRVVRLRLNPAAMQDGRGPYDVARAVVRLTDDSSTALHALAERVKTVSVERPNEVVIELRRAHTRPEALLKGALPEELIGLSAPRWEIGEETAGRVTFRRVAAAPGYQLIEEQAFQSEQEAIDALLRGDLHVLANLPPWRVVSMRRASGISVGEYRLPTVHCLLISPQSRLAESREARRSFCYGIARQRFVDSVLIAGDPLPGYQALSAPLPAGRSLGDPLRYAYSDDLSPRPYQPRLAALLGAVARKELAKKNEAASEEPLVLLLPPSPVARLACRSIESQLTALGLSINLIEATEQELYDGAIPHDLRYTQLTIGEPMVDAWPLFGPGGLAGDCSATLLGALERLDRAVNGKGVTDALQSAHEVLSGDLPIIPLWQTVDYYAFRTDLVGLPQETVDLYQTIDDWRLDRRGGRR